MTSEVMTSENMTSENMTSEVMIYVMTTRQPYNSVFPHSRSR